jgi:hypothetical protein
LDPVILYTHRGTSQPSFHAISPSSVDGQTKRRRCLIRPPAATYTNHSDLNTQTRNLIFATSGPSPQLWHDSLTPLRYPQQTDTDPYRAHRPRPGPGHQSGSIDWICSSSRSLPSPTRPDKTYSADISRSTTVSTPTPASLCKCHTPPLVAAKRYLEWLSIASYKCLPCPPITTISCQEHQ